MFLIWNGIFGLSNEDITTNNPGKQREMEWVMAREVGLSWRGEKRDNDENKIK